MSQSGDRDSRDSRRQVPPGAVVLVKNGFYEGLEVVLDRSSTIVGRGGSADFVIVEPTISREHATLGFDGHNFFVQDLASTNGTRVNGQQVDRHPLKDGDEIHLGKLVLEVTLPS